jgi:hypothetical protein
MNPVFTVALAVIVDPFKSIVSAFVTLNPLPHVKLALAGNCTVSPAVAASFAAWACVGP